MLPTPPSLPLDEQRVWIIAYSAAYAKRAELSQVNPAIDPKTLLECVANGCVSAYRQLRDEGPLTREDAEPLDERSSDDSNTP